MFGPNFAEGQTLMQSGNSLPMIEFPDDDELALEQLFPILHENDICVVKDATDADSLWQLALVADKYDYMAVLAPHSSSLFEGLNIRSTSGEYHSNILHNAQLIGAAYRFDNAEYFQKYTNALTKMGEYEMLEETNILKLSRIMLLYDRERECRDYLDGKIAQLAGQITPFLFRKWPPHEGHSDCEDCTASTDSDGNCDYHIKLATRYLEYLAKELLYPMQISARTFADCVHNLLQKQTHTLKGLFRQLEDLEHPDHEDLRHCEGMPGCGLRDFRRLIDPKMEDLKQCAWMTWAGLCLDCMKTYNIDAICCVQHGPFTLMRDLRGSKKRKRGEESDSEDNQDADSQVVDGEDNEWEMKIPTTMRNEVMDTIRRGDGYAWHSL